MTLNIRNLTRYIWVGVKQHDTKSIVEKKSAINLLVAFAVATKHYLREEYSYEFDDLRNLISHIRSFHIPSSNVPMSYQEEQHVEQIVRRFNGDHLKAHDVVTPTNIPLELSYYIESFINKCEVQAKCSDCTIQSMRTALSNLVECLTAFERILRTPIPLAYSVHLHHMTWLYILALPYQLVNDLGWWTVPIVGIATFSFLGILEIG
jgi:putative membrane protein